MSFIVLIPRYQSSYKYVRIAEWKQIALKENDNLFRCLLESFAFFLKNQRTFCFENSLYSQNCAFAFQKNVRAHRTVARFVQGRVNFFERWNIMEIWNISSYNLLPEAGTKKCYVKYYHVWSIAFHNSSFPIKITLQLYWKSNSFISIFQDIKARMQSVELIHYCFKNTAYNSFLQNTFL